MAGEIFSEAAAAVVGDELLVLGLDPAAGLCAWALPWQPLTSSAVAVMAAAAQPARARRVVRVEPATMLLRGRLPASPWSLRRATARVGGARVPQE